MERERSDFKSPLLVYKYSSLQALEVSIEMLYELERLKNIDLVLIEEKHGEAINLREFSKVKMFNESFLDKVDIIIIIGGDGTVLWANNLIKDRTIPILAFNLGTLGYLTYYNTDSFKEVFNYLFTKKGDYTNENRCRLDARISKSSEGVNQQVQLLALNEILIERGSKYMIELKISINSEILSSQKNDGILVSTPTGSTSYNLSAGGGILQYDLRCMLINSISPFTLSFRPICIPEEHELTFELISNSKARVINDGIEEVEISKGDSVVLKICENSTQIIIIDKFIPNSDSLWKDKIVQQLRWNKSITEANE